MQHWRSRTKKTHGVIEVRASKFTSQMGSYSLINLTHRSTLKQLNVRSRQRAISHGKGTRLSLGIAEQSGLIQAREHDIFVQGTFIVGGAVE